MSIFSSPQRVSTALDIWVASFQELKQVGVSRTAISEVVWSFIISIKRSFSLVSWGQQACPNPLCTTPLSVVLAPCHLLGCLKSSISFILAIADSVTLQGIVQESWPTTTCSMQHSNIVTTTLFCRKLMYGKSES